MYIQEYIERLEKTFIEMQLTKKYGQNKDAVLAKSIFNEKVYPKKIG